MGNKVTFKITRESLRRCGKKVDIAHGLSFEAALKKASVLNRRDKSKKIIYIVRAEN